MRKAAKLQRAGALTPRDRIWAAIRRFNVNGVFSVAEVMLLGSVKGDEALDFDSAPRADTTIDYLRGLVIAGFLAECEERPVDRPVRELRWFRLINDIGVEAPRVNKDGSVVTQGVGRQQLWNALRAHKGDFDTRELAIAASIIEHPVAHEEAKTYVRFLERAGYIVISQPATSAGARSRPARYRFVKSRNTGPRAPLITRAKEVMDTNTGAIVYSPKGGA